MKFIRIFLLVLIIIGIGLLFTQKFWVPPLVSWILNTENAAPIGAPGAGARCGGNMRNAPACGIGYHCAPEPGSHLPFGDVGGICVSD